MTRHLLYLNNHQLTALTWQSGMVQSERAFMPDDVGRAEFSSYLRDHADTPAWLLVDLIEEDFRLDMIPHVGARDRRVVLERRLQQVYRNNHYRQALLQGRDTEGRRDLKVLYTAITNDELIDPWVEILESQRVPLVGIYSVPLLASSLSKALQVTARHTLVVGVHHGGGLRQNYLQQGHLKFSRMTPMGEVNDQTLPAFIGEESRRTWQYLGSLSHVDPGELLQVLVIGDTRDEVRFRRALPDTPQIQYQFREIRELAARIGMRQLPEGNNAVALYIHLLGDRTVRNQLAPEQSTRFATVWRWKQYLWAASAAVLLVLGVPSAANWFEGRDLVRRIAQQEEEIERTKAQERAIRQSFPPSPVDPETMNNAVSFHSTIVAAAPHIETFAARLSAVLQQFPQIQLNKLEWAATTNARHRMDYLPSGAGAGPVQSVKSAAQTGAPHQPDKEPQPHARAGYYEFAIVEGTFTRFDNDYRRALDTIGRFQIALGRIPGVQVKPLALPLDTGPDVTLVGVDAPGTPPASDAAFALKLTVTPP